MMVTIQDVAKKAGVSTATVSHVLNNTRPVSQELTSRVLSAVEELNYRPSIVAKSLRKGSTHTIALILPDNTNPFFAEIGQAMDVAAYDRGYSLLLCNTGGSRKKELEYIELLIQKRVDGVAFCAIGNQKHKSVESLLSAFKQVVIIDDYFPNLEAANIVADNKNGGYLATKHLINLGHSRIACIRGPSELSFCENRFIGYREALEEAGIKIDPDLIVRGDWYPESGRFLCHKLLDLRQPPTAVFSSNDLMAFGVIRAVHERNLTVPKDLAVVGFDDIQLSSYATPSLTTISQPTNDIGRIAVELIVERSGKKSTLSRNIVLPVKLIVRQSCGGLPADANPQNVVNES